MTPTPDRWPPQAPGGLEVPEPLWSALRDAYGSAARAYHDLSHLRDVLRRFHEVASDVGWRQPREVFFALAFHDAVYVPGARDNEEASASMAAQSIARWLPESGIDLARVAELIRKTARHGDWHPHEVDPDQALFLDCDLAILGADAATFDAYEDGIAKEYASIPAELYRRGRARFLERLLACERIFLSDYFRDRLEATARENLRRSLVST